MIRNLVFVFSIIITTGCSLIGPYPNDPMYSPIVPDMLTAKSNNNGSLFISSGGLSLYSDVKAHRVGDIITVILAEETKANKDAANKLGKKSNATHINPTIFGTGAKFDLPKDAPLKEHKGLDLTGSISFDSKFDGNGQTTQNNKLTGNITVTVIQILPNNNLVIKGEKWITLSHGAEFIRLTGTVRAGDIRSDNTIESTRIANARITYSGKGALAEGTETGWMMKLFTHSWFPF